MKFNVKHRKGIVKQEVFVRKIVVLTNPKSWNFQFWSLVLCLFGILCVVGVVSAEPRTPLFSNGQVSSRPINPVATRQSVLRVRAKKRQEMMSAAQGLTVIFNALERGDAQSLQLIREEFLEALPGDTQPLMEVIRYAALENLYQRFSSRDWEAWPDTASYEPENSTPARDYVNSLTVVNRPLGRYLETAALMFHGMYIHVVKRGGRFDPEVFLDRVLKYSDDYFLSPRPPGISPDEIIDQSVLQDEVFMEMLAQVRVALIEQYMRRQPRKLRKQLLLLKDIDTSMMSRQLLYYSKMLVKRLAVNASVDYRRDVENVFLDNATISKLRDNNSVFRSLIARLYVVYALDAYEQKESKIAKYFLGLSEKTHERFDSQRRVEQLLTADAGAREPEAEPTQDESLLSFADFSEEEAAEEQGVVSLLENGAKRYLFPIMVCVVLGAILWRVYLAISARKLVGKGRSGRKSEPLSQQDFADLDDLEEQHG